MPKMTDEEYLNEILAKLSALEFVLEVTTANQMAHWSQADVNEFWRTMSSRPAHLPSGSGPVSHQHLEQMSVRVSEMISNFGAKVSERRRSIKR